MDGKISIGLTYLNRKNESLKLIAINIPVILLGNHVVDSIDSNEKEYL